MKTYQVLDLENPQQLALHGALRRNLDDIPACKKSRMDRNCGSVGQHEITSTGFEDGQNTKECASDQKNKRPADSAEANVVC